MTPAQWLAKLVAHNTISDRSTWPIVNEIADYLQGLGFSVHTVPNEIGDKAALFASIGSGDLNGGVCLSAHLDVVPVEGQLWDSDPFTLTQVGNKLYGRGSTDMKGFIACCLAIAPELAQNRPANPVHFCFSYDEEIGCLGVVPTIALMGKTLPRPDYVIVGEPTMMQVAVAHKSICSFETVLKGRGVHSSNHTLGIHTIDAARHVLGALAELQKELETIAVDDQFTPPFSTLHVGTIKGGSAVNIVPDHCEIGWEIRGLPMHEVAHYGQILHEKLAQNPEFQATNAQIYTQVAHCVPSFSSTYQGVLVEKNIPITVAYGTEAGHFEAASIPTIICGPGSIAQAHTPNEFIDVAQLDACVGFLTQRLILGPEQSEE